MTKEDFGRTEARDGHGGGAPESPQRASLQASTRSHTAGPWTAERLSDPGKWRGISIRAGNGHYIANMVFQLTENERANARLIAAAPDLLAALRLMQSFTRANCPTVEARTQAYEAMNSAIAKAQS